MTELALFKTIDREVGKTVRVIYQIVGTILTAIMVTTLTGIMRKD